LGGDGQQITVISRSVLKLFSEIANYLSVYQENYDKINDKFIKRFSRFYKLRDFAKASQNRQLLNTCELVQTYREDLFDLNKKIKQRLVSKEVADVIFTTTHKAKGQEYQNVHMVREDFITREQLENAVKNPDEYNFQKLREELNIFYVAATRAIDNISLHKF